MPRVLCAVTTVAVLGLASCKKEEPAPPPPPPPPPRIEQPKPLDAGSVLQSMDVDARVEFAEDAAPVSRDLAQAAIKLADAIARGDDEALRTMLDRTDHGSLDRLIASGQWYDATGKLEAVRVVSINTGARLDPAPEAAEIGLAVQDQDGAYVMLWAGRKVFDDWVFTARPASDEVRARATAWDGMSVISAPPPTSEPEAEAASGPLPPSDGSMADLRPLKLYIRMQMGDLMLQGSGEDFDINRQLTRTAQGRGIDESAVRKDYETGEREMREGRRLPAAEALEAIETLWGNRDVMKAAGVTFTKDDIIRWFSQASGVPESEVRAMYESQGG